MIPAAALLALLGSLPEAAPGPAPLLPVTRGTTKSGVAVVVVAAPDSPWAVAQLHLRLDASEITPKTRSATSAWAAQLAEVGRASIGPNGTIEQRLTPESLVLSFGVEAAHVVDAIAAIDSVLRARSNRPGSPPPRPPAPLSVVDDVVDAATARALFPGEALALSTEGGVLDATTARSLGDVLNTKSDDTGTLPRLAIVVVGPGSGEALLAQVNHFLTAPIRPTLVTAQPTRRKASVTISEQEGPSSSSSLTLLIPPRHDAAELLVLAALLGGHLVRSSGAVGIVVDVTAADRRALVEAENDAVDQVRRVAAAPPPPEVVDAAREQVLAARLSSLNDPARVAHALGQAVLDGRPTRVEDEIASLQALTPTKVSLAAAALAAAAVIIVRTPGPEPTSSASP